jgi:hypothetical protein
MEFYVPSGLSQDFDDMLDTPGFGTAVSINANLSATPVQTVVQLSNPNFKSNYQNLSDNARILRFSLSDSIKKGDYLTDTDYTYLVVWQPYKDINSWKSQCQICNTSITVESWQEAILDATTGETATPAEYIPIANDIVSFTARNGAGIFSSGTSEIGITPQNRLMIGMQFNANTSVIIVGHEFSFRNMQYRITSVDYSQLVDGEDIGCLVLYAEQLEGGRKSNSV